MFPDTYWDRLENVRRMAAWLQRLPISDDEIEQHLNLFALTEVEEKIRYMLQHVNVEVWCGEPRDPGRGNRPTSSEWKEMGLR